MRLSLWPQPRAEVDHGNWVAVGRRDALSTMRGTPIRVKDRWLALFMSDGEPYVVDNECPHRGVPMDDGMVEDGQVICPWHFWRFDLETGEHITGFGRRRGVTTYPTKVDANGTVWVEVLGR